MLRLAHSVQRIPITNERDFGELIFLHQLPHAGIIYFHLPRDTTAFQKIDWLHRILAQHTGDLGKYIVVEPNRLRVS